MSLPFHHKQGGKASEAILVGIVLALVVGGSAPWWWTKAFPEAQGPGTTAPQKGTYMGALEGATNRHGSDLSAVGIQSNSAAECSDLCDAEQNCRAMTFVKHSSANGGICWLKGAIPSPTPNQAMVSAIKLSQK
jgi:hypothetical protein